MTIVACLLAAITVACGLGLGQLARLSSARARAATAADAAALAAAGELAAGRNVQVAYRTALLTAAENGARLLRCQCHAPEPTVTVSVDLGGVHPFARRAEASSRAEIVPHCPGSDRLGEQESAAEEAKSEPASSKWRRRLASTGIATAGPASPG